LKGASGRDFSQGWRVARRRLAHRRVAHRRTHSASFQARLHRSSVALDGEARQSHALVEADPAAGVGQIVKEPGEEHVLPTSLAGFGIRLRQEVAAISTEDLACPYWRSISQHFNAAKLCAVPELPCPLLSPNVLGQDLPPSNGDCDIWLVRSAIGMAAPATDGAKLDGVPVIWPRTSDAPQEVVQFHRHILSSRCQVTSMSG